MDQHLLDIFIEEVGRQSKFALMSAKGMDAYLRNEFISGDIDEFWLQTQGFLISTGNLSKMFWNTEIMAKLESLKLREIFEVNKNSSLRSRRFRNLFEHYDEQIVSWSKESKQRIYASSNIMERGSIPIDSKDVLRSYYIDENVLVFRGEEYPIQPVINELDRIYAKCSKLKKAKYQNLGISSNENYQR